MSTEENKALVRRFIEESINQGNMAEASVLVANEHVAQQKLVIARKAR